MFKPDLQSMTSIFMTRRSEEGRFPTNISFLQQTQDPLSVITPQAQ